MALKNYGSIVYDEPGNKWVIVSAEPHVCIKLKDVFQKINKSQSVPFDFAHTPENCHDLLWFMERYPLSISPSNKNKMQQSRKAYLDLQDQLERIMSPNYTPRKVTLKEPWEPRDYQLKAAAFHSIQKKFLLGDDIGLGKTMTGTLTLNENTLPVLVVCQTHLKSHWKEKVNEYSDMVVHIIKGTRPYSLPKADVYVMTYSCLSGWVDTYQNGFFKSVIFDEVQELRRTESQKYEAARVLMYNVEYATGMSATPIYNYGDEIFNVMNLLNPGCLGNRDAFIREWCSPRGSHWIVNEPIALGTYLREKHLFLRRTRKDVGRELPEVNKVIHTVGYDSDEVRKATEIAKLLAIKATSGSFVERGQAARELDVFVRHQTGLSKAREVCEFVKLLLEAGEEKILLAGWHRDVYDIWLEELKDYKPVMYTGSESPAQKDKSKDSFIYGDARIFIISLRSGIGLDGLQKVCKCVVYGELDWSPKVHDQLTGRVDRDGQEEGVTAFYCLSEFGTDPIMIEILGLKSSQAHGIVDPLVGITTQLSDDTHLRKLAQSFLDKQIPELFEKNTA